jgi:hypothetical protein
MVGLLGAGVADLAEDIAAVAEAVRTEAAAGVVRTAVAAEVTSINTNNEDS